jgi:hypothetical protein
VLIIPDKGLRLFDGGLDVNVFDFYSVSLLSG